jgi:hypothetical protein
VGRDGDGERERERREREIQEGVCKYLYGEGLVFVNE